MQKARFLQVAQALVVQILPLPGEEGQNQPPLRPVIDPFHRLTQAFCQTLGQIAEVPPVPRLQHPDRSPAVEPQKNALGGPAVQLPDVGVPDSRLQPGPRDQGGQVLIGVKGGLAPNALCPDQTVPAVIRLLRIGQHRDLRGILRSRQSVGGGEGPGGVAAVPHQPQRQSQKGRQQQRLPASARQNGGQSRQQRRHGAPQPPPRRQDVPAEDHGPGKGQGKARQDPHGVSPLPLPPPRRKSFRAG